MHHDPAVNAALDAAERAARDDDYASAEGHLRDAVALQQARTGPIDPELANTLNNLGVACERAGKLDEAEASYRRAFAIAQEAFAPDHPFVLRSAENLKNFCEALGRPFDRPAADPAVTDSPHPPTPPAAAVVEDSSPIASDRPPIAGRPSERRAAWIAAALIVMLAGVAGLWALSHRTAPANNDSTASEAGRGSSTPPAPMASPVSPALPAAEPARSSHADTAGPSAPIAPAAITPKDSDSLAASAGPIAVVRADVCRNFAPASDAKGDWRCDTVRDATAPASLAFYTRVRSNTPVTIEHRWYRGDALVQHVTLRVGANPRAGFRTFSRNTVTPGTWRVEARTASGTLLAASRFTVTAR